MPSAGTSTSTTVCIGIEFAWWGGLGKGSPESCADVIIGQQVDSQRLWCRAADLRTAPNPLAKDPCQPNHDADAVVVTECLRKELNRLEESGARRFIVAIGAPIATIQEGHPERRRVLRKGDKGGVSRRSCESRFLEAVKSMGGPWGQGVNVQPGAPLAPRVSRFVNKLTHELGFVRWEPTTQNGLLPERVVIEVLPQEVIWALGIAGSYGKTSVDWIGRYRKCERCLVSRDDAIAWAKWPLSGFNLALKDVCDVAPDVDTIANLACNVRLTDGNVKLTKRYSSVVDAGINWLTAIAFRHGRYHWFAAEDRDGCLVGPGVLAGCSIANR